MTVSSRVRDGVILLAALIVALALLDASGLSFWQGMAITMAIFVVLVVSLNLANGFTGVFTLGQIGFMALGAYITAILTLPLAAKRAYLPDLPAFLEQVAFDQTVGGVPVGWLVATLIAALIVAGIAALVGAVLMRLSGPFVSVATLGFLVIVRVVLFNADSFTRGSRTFSNVTSYTNLWWAWGVAVVVVYAVWRIKRSSFGRQMFAQRGDKWAAQSVGHLGPATASRGVRGQRLLHRHRGLAVCPLHPVVLADRLLLRPDLPGGDDAGGRRHGIGERLGHRGGAHPRPGRGAAARRGRLAALRHQWPAARHRSSSWSSSSAPPASWANARSRSTVSSGDGAQATAEAVGGRPASEVEPDRRATQLDH